jgi:nicotinate-nucleotide adenylyltransferase
MTKRIGVLGGTFDPVHIGHLIAASEVHEQLNLDLVLFVPAGEPWQKTNRQITDAPIRRKMVEIAIADDPRFALSDVDLLRTGPTYAVDTIADLKQEYPQAQFFWIGGADVTSNITSWHRCEEFLAQVTLVSVNRPGATQPSLENETLIHVEIPDVYVSASNLRHRLAHGETCEYLIPKNVLTYLAEEKLYQNLG